LKFPPYTLFPTYWVRHEKQLHWRYKLEAQTDILSADEILEYRKNLTDIQELVLQVLRESIKLSHVIIVTLARPPWVNLSCKNFYPLVGKFLEENKIKVIYAQDRDGSTPQSYSKPKFESSQEAQQYWTEMKQSAIMGEVTKFYGESSWKNIISVGDSNFERAATQASLWDYATVGENMDDPEVGSAANKLAMLSPSKSKSGPTDANAVSGFVGRHYRRLRVKTVKMFGHPSLQDLSSEIMLLYKWISGIVTRDAGLDVDLEDEEQLQKIYNEFSGASPMEIDSE